MSARLSTIVERVMMAFGHSFSLAAFNFCSWASLILTVTLNTRLFTR